MSTNTVLVLGGSGNTGKYVVQQLVDSKQVLTRVIVRNQEKFRLQLASTTKDDAKDIDNLKVIEGSLLDMSDAEIEAAMSGVDVVVSCLGHTMDYDGIINSKNRRLVTDSIRRVLSSATGKVPSAPIRFILMGSDGVSHPAGTEPTRPWLDRALLWLCATLLSPHADNMEAAQFVYDQYKQGGSVEWIVVRPTNLVDADVVTEYTPLATPGPLLSNATVSRVNVAKFISDCVLNPSLWNQYKFSMPVLHNKEKDAIEMSRE
jgi:nucleoside-diphosphate-sugar epimerase